MQPLATDGNEIAEDEIRMNEQKQLAIAGKGIAPKYWYVCPVCNKRRRRYITVRGKPGWINCFDEPLGRAICDSPVKRVIDQ